MQVADRRHQEGDELSRFAARLRALRSNRGFSLADLAGVTGLSRGYLSRLELGERQPSLSILIALSRAFAVRASDLIDSEPETTTYRRIGEARWRADVRPIGQIQAGNQTLTSEYSFDDRIGDSGLNPEELLGASQAACAAMSLHNILVEGGHSPKRIYARAEVQMEHFGGNSASLQRLTLLLEAEVPDISEDDFHEAARQVSRKSPVAKVLTGLELDIRPVLLPHQTP